MRYLFVVISLISWIPPVHAGALGRLFFTPEERATYGKIRDGMVSTDEPSVMARPSQITVNGLVSRSGGKGTIWINGVAYRENDKNAMAAITSSGKQIEIKVGQTYEASTGTLREGYYRRPLEVNLPKKSSAPSDSEVEKNP